MRKKFLKFVESHALIEKSVINEDEVDDTYSGPYVAM